MEAREAPRREWLTRASGTELVPTTLLQPGTALSTWSWGWPEMFSPGYSPREETEDAEKGKSPIDRVGGDDSY